MPEGSPSTAFALESAGVNPLDFVRVIDAEVIE